jgi:hypothetical protein
MLVGWRAVAHGGAAVAAAAAVLAGAAAAHRPPAPRPTDRPAAREGMPTIRERLDWRARNLETRAATLREAIRRLDAGESEDEVRRYLDNSSALARLLGDPSVETDARFVVQDRPQPPHRPVGRERPQHERPGVRPDGPRPGPDGARPERPQGDAPLTPQEREVVLELARKTSPDYVDDIEKDPERMRRLGMMARWLVELKQRDRVAYDLKLERMGQESKALRLAGSIAKRLVPEEREPEQVAKFRAELRETAGRVFDLRIAEQTHELAQLEARLEAIRAEIASQESRREELIEEQIAKLMQSAMRWAEEKAKGKSEGEKRELPVMDVGRERGEGKAPQPPR